MTKEITKSIILQQIQDKFKLRDFEPANFLFDETVIPVYDIGPHLYNRHVMMKTMSVTAGPAGILFFTVPMDERWTFTNYNVTFMTGVFTVTGLYIHRTATGTESIYLDQVLGRTGSYAINVASPIVLDAGDKVWMYIDGYTSTGDLRLTIDVMKETIR